MDFAWGFETSSSMHPVSCSVPTGYMFPQANEEGDWPRARTHHAKRWLLDAWSRIQPSKSNRFRLGTFWPVIKAVQDYICYLLLQVSDVSWRRLIQKYSANILQVKKSRTFWNHGYCESHLSMLTSKIIQNHPKSPKCALLQELHNIHVVKPRISPRSDWATWSPPGLVTIPPGSSMASLEMDCKRRSNLVHQGLLCSRKMLHVKSWKTKTSDWKSTHVYCSISVRLSK